MRTIAQVRWKCAKLPRDLEQLLQCQYLFHLWRASLLLKMGNIINASLQEGIRAGTNNAPGNSITLSHNSLATALCEVDLNAHGNHMELKEERIPWKP